MFNSYKQRKAIRIRGQVINIVQDQTYDMGGQPMIFYSYLIQLENGCQITLSDKLSNSYVEHLGLELGSIVTVNGFGKLVK